MMGAPEWYCNVIIPKCYSANVPLNFCTTADFEMKYFFNEGTAGVLGNRYLTDFLAFAAKASISTQN